MSGKLSVRRIVLLCTIGPAIIVGLQVLIYLNDPADSFFPGLAVGIGLSVAGGVWAMTRGGKLPPAQQPPERDK